MGSWRGLDDLRRVEGGSNQNLVLIDQLHSDGWVTAAVPKNLGGQGVSALDILCMSNLEN
jgi:hypothetical protein